MKPNTPADLVTSALDDLIDFKGLKPKQINRVLVKLLGIPIGSIKELMKYEADSETELTSFQETCECEEPSEEPRKCKCKANEKHIYREFLAIRKWIKEAGL